MSPGLSFFSCLDMGGGAEAEQARQRKVGKDRLREALQTGSRSDTDCRAGGLTRQMTPLPM